VCRSGAQSGYELLSLVEETELCPLVGIDDCEDTSDALANVMDASELGRASGDLASPERDQLAFVRQHSGLYLGSYPLADARLKLLELGVEVLLRLAPQLGGLL